MQPNPNNRHTEQGSKDPTVQLSTAHNTEGSPSNDQILLTRRQFFYGSMGVGALALTAGALGSPSPAFAADEIEYLKVPEENVFNHDDCTEIPASDKVSLIGSFQLPYGTLIWCNSNTVAACLLPTETSVPLTKVAVLFLGSGSSVTVLETAVGQAENFEIYDVRANEQGLIWTEANILTGIWRVYTAPLDGETLGKAALVDEGDAGWETPSIAAVAKYGFWQVLPVADGDHRSEDSLLKKAEFGKETSETVYASTGRMSTPPYALEDSVVITPRTSTDAIHHQLTLLDASSNETKDSMVLPAGMKPLEAGYGTSGFNFSFDGIYNYGGGIANLGTYTPAENHSAYDYDNKTWFRFGRTPSAPPSCCGNLFIVKSLRSVCGIDLAAKTFFALDVESGASSYGDYLASSGINENFVTYSNVHSISIEGTEEKHCLVRVWAPLT